MLKSSPEEKTILFKDFKEMQERHLTILAEEKNSSSLRDLDNERRAMLQRLKNWFASEAPAEADPQFLRKELKAILEKEEQLKNQADSCYREIQAALETIRVGKKLVNRYREKGSGLGTSPHFVSKSA